jgi:hypothetical protein
MNSEIADEKIEAKTNLAKAFFNEGIKLINNNENECKR